MTRVPSKSCGTSWADSLKVVLCLLVLCALTSCAWGRKDLAPVVRQPETIWVHWMKAGEAAPFPGILLSEEAYSGLREKVIRLEGELERCRRSQ
jgi:hypothetical protein